MPTPAPQRSQFSCTETEFDAKGTVAAPISADTRARILASAAVLGYQPNAVARSLITKRSGLAGVLLTEATQRDTPEVLILLAQALLAQGFQPLLFPCTHESEQCAVNG